jgi:hypothetical protein
MAEHAMEISYQVTQDDLIAFCDHFYRRSSTLRKQNRLVSLWVPVLYLLLGAGVWLATERLIWPIALAAFAVLYGVLVPARMKRLRRRQFLRMYREGENRALFEPQTMSIEREGLVLKAASGVSLRKWASIDGIDTTLKATFVFLSPLMAHVLSRTSVIEGDYDSFVNELKRRFESATASERMEPAHPTLARFGEHDSAGDLSSDIANSRTELAYKLTEQDLIAFSEYQAGKSRTLRSANQRAARVLIGTLVLAAISVGLVTRDLVFGGILLVVAVIAACFIPSALRGSRRKLASRVYRETKHRDLVGPRRLRIGPEVIVTESPAGASQVKWTYIERVDATEAHTFVYQSVANAIVIPKHGVIGGDYDLFTAELARSWRESRAPQPHVVGNAKSSIG